QPRVVISFLLFRNAASPASAPKVMLAPSAWITQKGLNSLSFMAVWPRMAATLVNPLRAVINVPPYAAGRSRQLNAFGWCLSWWCRRFVAHCPKGEPPDLAFVVDQIGADRLNWLAILGLGLAEFL